ncbi:hypothetical protein GCM10008995_25020 [Halobellus salinus]|uniref:Uncharacterized protein n=1 Tax=Halobellus salinus TaxID=931585 RepID=A0A830EI86_9EURY|nr:hypothetical protein [Halobellus salinus]GGJ14114.1 hypothetical protein GCM10008995_25020 [Halobellus salinus]SMP31952.1 hypothetical protein SAMN06265347_11932 [Halobellus salinus]
MTRPPRDDPPAAPDGDGRDADSTPGADPTPGADRDVHKQSGRGGPADHTDTPPGGGVGDDAGTSEFDDPLGDLLPRPGVDSRWWYWIAAVPVYVVVGVVLGVLFAVVALAGFGLGIDGGLIGVGLLFVVVLGLGLVGLVLTLLFPIATYVDARAVAASDASWTPDPLVWGLAALATVVLSAFTLSFVMAIYYLYKRHAAVGTP